MKLNNLFVILYGLGVIFSCVFSFSTYKQSQQRNDTGGLIEQITFLSQENNSLIEKLNEVNSYVQFMEQSIPEIQKRNAKARVVRDIVQQTMKNTKENHFKSEREFNDYSLSVVDYSDRFKVPVSLILAVSRTESNFNPRAVSSTNAQGIMQMLPSTSATCVSALNKQHHDPFYVRDSVECGAWYLRQMLNLFKDEKLVIQSYNVGPTFILKYEGNNLPEETINYHEKVSGFIAEYKPKMKWEN